MLALSLSVIFKSPLILYSSPEAGVETLRSKNADWKSVPAKLKTSNGPPSLKGPCAPAVPHVTILVGPVARQTVCTASEEALGRGLPALIAKGLYFTIASITGFPGNVEVRRANSPGTIAIVGPTAACADCSRVSELALTLVGAKEKSTILDYRTANGSTKYVAQ